MTGPARVAKRPGPAAPAPPAKAPGGAWRAWSSWAAVLLAVLIQWRLRVHVAHSTPTWDAASPVGVMKSDTALVHWFAERIARNGGAIPDDFARTQAVLWPDVVDARVEFPMAQPWLAANLWRWLGGGAPLHVFCVSLFGLIAALSAAAVFGLAHELCGRRDLALLAMATWMLLPASWRTLGFVLLGEDLALPAFAWHLWLLARAARVRTAGSFLLAGAPLALAMAAWHATGFFVAVEAGAFFAWYLRSGRNPFSVARSWLVLLPFAAACAFEPMLRGKVLLLSLPMQLALALLVLLFLERRRPLPAPLRVGAAIALVAAFAGLAVGVAKLLGAGISDYSHVFGLITAKLAHLGVRPRDPSVLSFEVRALWQGPFDTTQPQALLLNLGTTLIAAAWVALLALPAWVRGRGRESDAILALLCAVSLLGSWLINRTLILSGLLFPVAAAVALRPLAGRLALAGAALVLLGPPAWKFGEFLDYAKTVSWHDPVHKRELVGLVDAIGRHVPDGAPVASDEVNSTAILAFTGHPMVAQPKYEWTAARARLEEYRTAAIRGSPADLAAFLRRWRCRHVVFDWYLLWGTRYQAGIPDEVTMPAPDSALAIVARDPERLPGFKLLWKSPLDRSRLRLYELTE